MRVCTLNSLLSLALFIIFHVSSSSLFYVVIYFTTTEKKKKKRIRIFIRNIFLLCSAFFSALYIIYFAVKQHISFVIHFLFKLDFNTHINHKISSNKMAAMWKIIITIFVLTVIGRYDNLDLFLTYS